MFVILTFFIIFEVIFGYNTSTDAVFFLFTAGILGAKFTKPLLNNEQS